MSKDIKFTDYQFSDSNNESEDDFEEITKRSTPKTAAHVRKSKVPKTLKSLQQEACEPTREEGKLKEGRYISKKVNTREKCIKVRARHSL